MRRCCQRRLHERPLSRLYRPIADLPLSPPKATWKVFFCRKIAFHINSWRGAKVGFLRNFSREFPNAKTFKLEENFRSTSHILDASNAVISFDPSRIEKTLFTRRGEGLPIEVLGFSYASEEAEAIAREIGRRAAAGAAWHDMAIIYRQNRLSRALEEALLHARVPYEIVGDVGFYQRTAVKDALALLTLSSWPDERQSDEAFRRVANKPARGLGAK
ncbi:3'-5' exonuclease, partial [Acetobacter fallax]|uniref:3'-5' exonuclease n=1 Tax=Acetobacter fallax TaxID=1737473 RepID=UPI0030CBAEEB